MVGGHGGKQHAPPQQPPPRWQTVVEPPPGGARPPPHDEPASLEHRATEVSRGQDQRREAAARDGPPPAGDGQEGGFLAAEGVAGLEAERRRLLDALLAAVPHSLTDSQLSR